MTVRSFNGYVPYLFLASFLATWLRIRIIVVFTLVIMIIQMALSGYSMQSDGAGYGRVDPHYKDWFNQVCDQSPTIYLQPFSFTYVSKNITTGVTISSSQAAYCPFPTSNSAFRLTVLCVGFVTFVALIVQRTVLSYFARTICLCYSLLFFSCFVLDTNQSVTGFTSCHDNFYGTTLGQSLTKYHVDITCTSSAEAPVILFDFLLSLLFYLLFECWGMCADLYGEQSDRVSVITKRNSFRAVSSDVENPMQKGATKKTVIEDNTNYNPYEPAQEDYTPYTRPEQNYAPYNPKDKTNYAPYNPKQSSVNTTPTKSTSSSASRSTPTTPFSGASPSKAPMATPPRKPPATPTKSATRRNG